MNKVDVPASSTMTGSAPEGEITAPAGPGSSWRRYARYLSITNISVIYVEIALIVVFSIWAPQTFPTMTTVKSIINGGAVPGLMALAVVIPLSARLFDLSIGNGAGLANMLVAWLLVNHNWGVVPAIVATLAVGFAIGIFNGLVVIGARIDSFIGTLATGALFATVTSILSTQTISGNQLNGAFSNIATIGVFGINLPAWFALGVAIVIFFIQRYTATGRRIYALGFSERGSELVGIRAKRLKFASLVAAGVIVGIAGILLASSVTSGDPSIGPPYLLNAYAAAFLGATQFGGRFNAFGTVLAVILLETGTNGIYLVGGQPWAQSLFTGVVLLLALGVSNLEQAIRVRSWVRAKSRQRRMNEVGGRAGLNP